MVNLHITANAGSSTPCGTVLIVGGAWLQGQGVDVKSNGVGFSDCQGQGSAGFGWQCVDLAFRLYNAHNWGRVFAANDGGAQWIPEGSPSLTFHGNGTYRPQPGDLIVEYSTPNNSAGHVAVVDSISGGTINAVEQNTQYLTGGVWYDHPRHPYSIDGGNNITGGYGTVKGTEHSPSNNLSGLPSVPTGLAAVSASGSTVNLTWNAAQGATSYQVWRTGAMVGTTSATSFTDTGLRVGVTYSYAIVAVNSAGQSPPSAGAVVYTSGPLIQFVANSGWSAWNITSSSGGPNIASNPVFSGNSVWAQASNGHLVQFVPPSGSNGWGAYDITAAASNGTSIVGSPMYAGGSVWAQASNGHLVQFVPPTGSNGWGAYDITAAASNGTSIVGSPMYAGGSVWAQASNGHLVQFVPPSGSNGWGTYDITAAASNGTSIVGSPMYAGGSVWAQASNGHLVQFVPPNGSNGWGAYDITAAASNGTSIVGDPMFSGTSVWAQASNGHLYQFVPPNGSSGWGAYDITTASNGPSIASDPMFSGSSAWAVGA
jgi:hypothetical protein